MERSAGSSGTTWEGLPALDREGEHLGTCVRAFSASGVGTSVTEWVVVDVEGRGPSVLPGRDATEADGRLTLDVVRAVVLNAPTIGDVAELTDEAVAALSYHYGLSDQGPSSPEPAGTGEDDPTASSGSARAPLAALAGLAAAVAVGLGMRGRRARRRRR